MHLRTQAALLACAALAAVSSAGPVLAADGSPALSHIAAAQPLAWSIVPSPNRAVNGRTHGSLLYGVSCPSASFCTAVGYAANGGPKTLAETWNGTAWSIVPSPNRLPVGRLDGVSCISASACTAVGVSLPSKTSTRYRTLIETWNGTAWSLVPSPNPATGQGSDGLSAISCVSASACTAVGSYKRPSGQSRPLIESWNGSTWTVVPSPHPGSGSALNGVSCTAADNCSAVGGYASAGIPSRTLVESWNGTTWSVVPSPAKGNRGNSSLAGVSCISASACTAVGTYYGNIAFRTLVETWNGTTWSVVPSPDVGPRRTEQNLESVSCASASACTAVGSNILAYPLVEAWDGTQWSIVPTPRIPGSGLAVGDLSSVSCPSATMCMAAGSRDRNERQNRWRTLTEMGVSSG